MIWAKTFEDLENERIENLKKMFECENQAIKLIKKQLFQSGK